MPDKLNPQQRHKCMQSIRSKNTTPELLVRRFLFAHGFRYRLNVKKLPGTPDIVLHKYRTAIFINGCFWHGHKGCKYFVMPKTNSGFWQAKITRNQERDLQRRIDLRKLGWHTITIWECQLKPKNREQTLLGLEKTLCQIYLGDRKTGESKSDKSLIVFMGCFIIKVNGSLRVDFGKHYLGSLSFGGFECVSDNAVPGNYNYDNCVFIDSGDYTHIGKGTLLTQLISDVKLFVNEIVNLYNKSK